MFFRQYIRGECLDREKQIGLSQRLAVFSLIHGKQWADRRKIYVARVIIIQDSDGTRMMHIVPEVRTSHQMDRNRREAIGSRSISQTES
jgi:hypothetical protein